MKKINIIIDGIKLKVNASLTILEAALQSNIYIPNLCYHKDLTPSGNCRMCLVEINNNKQVIACQTYVEEGMTVTTESEGINSARQLVLELIHANHIQDCTNCKKNTSCQLQEVTSFVGINEARFEQMRKNKPHISIDDSNPFFNLDHNKCILCGICIRTCNEIQGVDALQFGYRGYDTVISTFLDKPIKESVCESCGECVVRCPVGALTTKNMLIPSREVKTICPYCGVGCGITLGIRGEKIISIEGDSKNPVNEGRLCVKGRFGYNWINHKERLKNPLIKKSGKFVESSWDEALELIAKKFSGYKGDEFATFSSARCTNEDNYVIQKFTRSVMGSNNIDHCARLCHSPSVAGLAKSLGSGAMTNSINEITESSCIFAIGTNTTEAHPVIGLKVKEAQRKGAKIIVANPRRIDLCKFADIWLQQRTGTDVVLLMGICKVIADKNLVDNDFIKERCENYNDFKNSLKKFELDYVENITGVSAEKIQTAAEMYANNSPASILYAMGITQHTHGTDNVLAISNLALLTGNIGKPSSGVNPLRGQNNVQGACDMGALPNVYPGYQKVSEQNVKQKFEKAWNTKLNDSNGLTLTEIVTSAGKKEIKALYLVGENSLLSEPDATHVKKALQKLDFFVAQDIFLTETAQLADVVLPAASFAEKDGTFTNTERRVQRIRKAINPIENARPDWWITCQIAKKMDHRGFDFKKPENIFDEISSLVPSYKGISYKRIEKEGLMWPVKDKNHEGTPVLHKNKFLTENGKAGFVPLEYIPSAEIVDSNYPLILTTERSLYQYHTGTMTRRVDGLNILNEKELVKINPADAKELGLSDGDKVIVSSRRGKVEATIKISKKSLKGVVAMSFHFFESPTNIITNPATDPVAKIPELKSSAVKIKKKT